MIPVKFELIQYYPYNSVDIVQDIISNTPGVIVTYNSLARTRFDDDDTVLIRT